MIPLLRMNVFGMPTPSHMGLLCGFVLSLIFPLKAGWRQRCYVAEMNLKPCTSCFRLPRAGITGLGHYTRPDLFMEFLKALWILNILKNLSKALVSKVILKVYLVTTSCEEKLFCPPHPPSRAGMEPRTSECQANAFPL